MTAKELKELIKEVIVERLKEGEWSPEKPPLPWGYANPHGHKFEDTAPQNVAIMPIWKALKSNPSYTDVSVVPWSFAGDKQNRVRAEAHGVIDGKRVTFSAYGPNDIDVEVVDQNDGKSIKKKLSSVDGAINFSKTLSTKLEANTSELEKLGFQPVKESPLRSLYNKIKVTR